MKMIRVSELLKTMKDFDKVSKVVIITGGECIPYDVEPINPDPGWEYATEDHLKLLNEHGGDRVESWYYPMVDLRKNRYLFIEIRRK